MFVNKIHILLYKQYVDVNKDKIRCLPRQLEPVSAADDAVPQSVAASWVRPLAYRRRRRLAPVRPPSPCPIMPGLPLLSDHILDISIAIKVANCQFQDYTLIFQLAT